MADRPIEILDVASDEEQQTTAAPEIEALEPPVDLADEVESLVEHPSEPPLEPTDASEAITHEQCAVGETQPQKMLQSESAQEERTPLEEKKGQTEAPSDTAKTRRARKSKSTGRGTEKKLSALDAAAKVLGETGQPMNCREMIEAMAAKGYWASPGGKTPTATLYSAIAREIAAKGVDSRFRKTDRAKFTRAIGA